MEFSFSTTPEGLDEFMQAVKALPQWVLVTFADGKVYEMEMTKPIEWGEDRYVMEGVAPDGKTVRLSANYEKTS